MLRVLARRGHELTYLMPLPLGAPAPDGVRLLDTATRHVSAESVASRLVSYAGASPPIRIPGEATPPAGAPLYGSDLLAEVERFARESVERVITANARFDVIHAHDWTTFRAGLALRERTGKPLVAHVHITEFDKSGGQYADPAVFALEREGIAGADRVVAVSRRIANTCRDRYGADPRAHASSTTASTRTRARRRLRRSRVRSCFFSGASRCRRAPSISSRPRGACSRCSPTRTS